MKNWSPPIHPGEILREEFLVPLGMSAGALARAIGVPRTRIERIAKETMGITPDTALRLARYFGSTPNFWLNMQVSYDLTVGAPVIARELDDIIPLAASDRNAA